MSEVKIEGLVTSGFIGSGGQQFSIENNVWLIGDDKEVLVIDAAHDAEQIAAAVGERETLGILLTHGHQDHINAAVETAGLLDAHIYLHPDDLFLWREFYESEPDFELHDGQEFHVAGLDLQTIHTPGHTPGSVCFNVLGQDTVFSGDTLFQGGPGATRWEYSDFKQIIESIQQGLFQLPANTLVLPGHGAQTTIAAEEKQLEAYISRGW